MNVDLSVGIDHRTVDNKKSSNLRLGLLASVDTLRGAQIGLLSSTVKGSMSGLNFSPLIAVSSGNANGFQFGSLLNTVKGRMSGLQVGGLSCIVHDMRGVQLGAVWNIADVLRGVQVSAFGNFSMRPMRGLQVCGVTNISMGVKKGLQISAIANISSSCMRGFQFSTYNYADTLNGVQAGLINICIKHPRGIQVGVFNYSRDSTAHKIGLININPGTRIDFLGYAGSLSKINFALRFSNRSTYNVLGVGTHYMGLDKRFSGAVFYRLGEFFQLSPRFALGGDIGYFHVETFEHNTAQKPTRLYSLQARLTGECRINRTLAAFVAAGYADTRYYWHHRHYKDGLFAEAGLAIRYHRNKKK